MRLFSETIVDCWRRGEIPVWLWVIGLPLAAAFWAGVWLRNAAFEVGLLARGRPGIPIVSVGNLAVGGTGKTPMTRHVVRTLVDAGRSPSVVLRGYGDDEIELHRRWTPQVPVVGAPDRTQGARVAMSEGARSVVLDDGFQHRRIGRDLDIVLVAAEHPLPIRLMPLGPYRETARALRRAHLIVITWRTDGTAGVAAWKKLLADVVPETSVAVAQFVPDGWIDVEGREIEAPTGATLAVTGIAQPDAFEAMVRDSVDGALETMTFPDHHQFKLVDVERIEERAGGRPIVTTEKDAVKLGEFVRLRPALRILRLGVRWSEGETKFRSALEGATAGAAL